jgi:hypothetical protein
MNGLGNLRYYFTPAIKAACHLYGAPSDDTPARGG